MDQHPIPQDVTGFQFKLIGTMTVKQFGFVASGVVAAVVLYYLPIQSVFAVFIKLFFVPMLGVSGVIIAFVPIDGRPIDVMATNFTKALFSPNQYVYHRQGRKLSFETISVKASPPKIAQQNSQPQRHLTANARQLNEKEEKLRTLLLNSHGQAKNEVDKKEAAFLKTLTLPTIQPVAALQTAALTRPQPIATMPKLPATIQTPPPAPVVQTVAPKPPINEGEQKEEVLIKKESELALALTQAKQEESTSKTPETHTAAQQKVLSLNKQIDEIHTQKQKLEQELSNLQKQLVSQKAPVAVVKSTPPPASQPTQPVQKPQYVRTLPQEVTKKAGLPHISDSPNVVVGIVKDPRGNILPNILVEVKDKDDNPVRAFKTNLLGQFASATPLSPGTYTIELEDPKKLQRFDRIQVVANNQIMLPIEITSHDAREDLRKQLFAN